MNPSGNDLACTVNPSKSTCDRSWDVHIAVLLDLVLVDVAENDEAAVLHVTSENGNPTRVNGKPTRGIRRIFHREMISKMECFITPEVDSASQGTVVHFEETRSDTFTFPLQVSLQYVVMTVLREP